MDRARIRNRIQRLTIKDGLQIAQGNGLGTVDCDIWNFIFHEFGMPILIFFTVFHKDLVKKNREK